MSNKSKYLYNKRKARTRFRLKNSCTKNIRLSVFRSNSNIYAQIIDDQKQLTLVSASSYEKDIKSQNKNKSDISLLVAEKLAKKAKDKNINKIYFDRGMYKYHGRVKIFAETLRKNGLEF